MSRLISLLNEKNHYLEKFYTTNETEITRFNTGDFDNIETFYSTREKILDMIRYIDHEIEKINANEENLNTEDKKEIARVLRDKEEFVNRIIAQDLEMLSCIESAKSEIIRELRDVNKNKKAVGGYRSPKFDHRLDEEA